MPKRPAIHAFYLFLLAGFLLTALPAFAEGDDDAQTTDDPVIEALERKKQIAELEKAIAVAEKETLAAKLPATEGSGISGSVSLTDAGYFAEILAFRALDDAAAQLAADLGSPAAGRERVLVVLDDDLAKRAQLWEVATLRVADADRRLRELIAEDDPGREAVGAALLTATSILGAVADIASFFRTDLSVTGHDVEVGSAALAAAVADRLRRAGWKPVVPTASLARTQLLTAIDGLLASRARLAARRVELEATFDPILQKHGEATLALAAAEAELAKVKAAKGDVAAAEQTVREAKATLLPLTIQKTRWDRAAARIDAALTATDSLVQALVVGAEAKPSVVEAVAAVDVAKSDPGVRLLHLDTSSQGGEVHVAKGAFQTRLVYVGGVVLSYLLSDQNGNVERSGVVARSQASSARAKDAAHELSLP